MIYYKVPVIDDELIKKALAHSKINNRDGVKKTYSDLIKAHPYATKQRETWPDRNKELKEITVLYYYLKSMVQGNPDKTIELNQKISDLLKKEEMLGLSKVENSILSELTEEKRMNGAYTAYFETLDRMVNRKGLITDQSSSFPRKQFESFSLEPLALQALKASEFAHEGFIVEGEEGQQDHGIDALIRDKRIDVKTSKHYRALGPYDKLGKIKTHALDDNKLTDYILWTGNHLTEGYITLKGSDRWDKLKEQISKDPSLIKDDTKNGYRAENGWTREVWDKFQVWDFKKNNGSRKSLEFYALDLRDADKSRLFNQEFLGDFSNSFKQEVKNRSVWLEDEFSFRAKEKTEINTLIEQGNSALGINLSDLVDSDVKEVDRLISELGDKYKGYLMKEKIKEVGKRLVKRKKDISNIIKDKESTLSITKTSKNHKVEKEMEL